MSSAEPDSTPSPKYHPQFETGLAADDIILQSSDNVLYRVPCFVLPPLTFAASPVSILVSASSDALTPLLLTLSGFPVPPFPDFDTYSQTVLLAQSWRAPLGALRGGAVSHRFLEDPLAVYALAARCGWDVEAAIAARKTLVLDLYDEDNAALLETMPAGAVVRLFQYHRSRRDGFRLTLGEEEKCAQCDAAVDGGEWRMLRAKLVAEIENGNEDGVCSLEMEEWAESEACWALRCKECDGPVYDRLKMLRKIRDAVRALPDFQNVLKV